jgi:four helix bundle protein
MSEIRSYKDLLVWQKAMELAERVFVVTKQLPADERFGLISQLRRASVSVPSNIAEGYGRGTRPDYLRFLRTARGSLFEIATQLQLSSRFGYLNVQTHDELIEKVDECGRILAGLIRKLEDVSD